MKLAQAYIAKSIVKRCRKSAIREQSISRNEDGNVFMNRYQSHDFELIYFD